MSQSLKDTEALNYSAKIMISLFFSKDKILKNHLETFMDEVCFIHKIKVMKSAFIKQNDGYGYSSSMLPNYDGFIIIKPGFLKHTDEIINELHRRDFVVIEAEEKTLTREEAETIYSCHKDKDFFNELIEYMTEGPCIGVALQSPFSDRVSATEALNHLKIKYRRRYGIDTLRNVIHSSDCYQSAIHEAETFFNDLYLD